jgi:hypothetical protein
MLGMDDDAAPVLLLWDIDHTLRMRHYELEGRSNEAPTALAARFRVPNTRG